MGPGTYARKKQITVICAVLMLFLAFAGIDAAFGRTGSEIGVKNKRGSRDETESKSSGKTKSPAGSQSQGAGKSGSGKKVKYVQAPDGLNTLIKMSGDRQKMTKILVEETKNYENAKKAVSKGNIKAGDSASLVRKSCGEPVLILAEGKDGSKRWVYKPMGSTYFEGEKIYLFFDSQDKFVKWETVE